MKPRIKRPAAVASAPLLLKFGEPTVKGVSELIGDKARPVAIDRELLSNLDEGKRLELLKKWQAARRAQ